MTISAKYAVETWPIEKPVEYDKNARIIPQAAIDLVAKSLESAGFQQPIVVDEQGVVIAGHTRLKAAKQLGYTEVPIHVARGLTENQVKAYRLMDNRSNQDTMWDTVILRDELNRLADIDDLDPSLTGFSDTEFAAFASKVDIGRFQDAPKSFKEFDSAIEVDIKCPHCGYEWKKGQGTRTSDDESPESAVEPADAPASGTVDDSE